MDAKALYLTLKKTEF